MRLNFNFRRRCLWHCLSAILVVGFTGCTASTGGDGGNAGGVVVPAVGVVTPTVGDVSRKLTQPASLQGLEEVTLYARASGYLKELRVDRGDRVSKGQVLGILESPELEAESDRATAAARQATVEVQGARDGQRRVQAEAMAAGAGVERSRAEVTAAEADVRGAVADLETTRARLQRARSAIQEGEAQAGVAEADRGTAEADAVRRRTQVGTAQATVRGMQASRERAEAELRLHQSTFERLRAVQQKDQGLIAAQQVDEARTRAESARAEVASARSRVEASEQELMAAQQQAESAARHLAAADRKLEVARRHIQSLRDDAVILEREVERRQRQVEQEEARLTTTRREVEMAAATGKAAQARVSEARTAIRGAEAKALAAGGSARASSALSAYRTLVAPITGVVTERMIDPGALVTVGGAGAGTPRGVLKIARDERLRVMVPVPEAASRFVRPGTRAEVALEAVPGDPIPASVTRVSGAIEPRSRTLMAEIELNNREKTLRPGMYARVTLTLEVHRGALSLPADAVAGKDPDRFVYLVKGDTARKTPVKVGVEAGKSLEIVEGVKPGDQVVLTGRDSLVDGSRVKAEPAKLDAPK